MCEGLTVNTFISSTQKYSIASILKSVVLTSILFYSHAENNTTFSYPDNTSIFNDFDDAGFYIDNKLVNENILSRRRRSSSWQDAREKRRLHLLSRALVPAGQLNTFRSAPSFTGSAMSIDPYENYWGNDGNTQMWQGPLGSYGSIQPFNGQQSVHPSQTSLSAAGGYVPNVAGSTAGAGAVGSPYAGYLEKQISSYPVMIYTLNDCIPCQRTKQLLAQYYPDVRAHFLELSGNEPWQQQLQVDLQYLTGAITFPYIFVCGQYIGGSSDLFEMHESGQLRRMISQCLKTAVPKI